MDDNAVTPAELEAFSAVERAGSVLSLIGCLFIITTFCSSKAFHKPINRLIFYATFGNLMTNVATLMARSYIGDTGSPGCQLQAFLIQMFMPADAFWALAMAANVYLTFFHKFDAHRLRRVEIPYLLLCYGIPFVIALALAFVSSPEKGKMYGNATLWCWVSTPWDIFRIVTFYGPVWVAILITFTVYIRAGGEIYKRHKQLRNFDFSTSHHETELRTCNDDPFSSIKTTEVSVTHESVENNGIDLSPLGPRDCEAGREPKAPNAQYSVTISSSNRNPERESFGDVGLPIQTNSNGNPGPLSPSAASQQPTTPNPARRRHYEANSAAWSYAKCAFLFFTAMLVTWIPSSANRVYSVIHINKISLPLEYMSAFVLPLQGFWNALIYAVTSWGACKALARDVREYFRPSPKPKTQELNGNFRTAEGQFKRVNSEHRHFHAGITNDKAYESESMTELAAQSRHSSHDQGRSDQSSS